MNPFLHFMYSACLVVVLHSFVWPVAILPTVFASAIPGFSFLLHVTRIAGWYIFCSMITRAAMNTATEYESLTATIIFAIIAALFVFFMGVRAYVDSQKRLLDDLNQMQNDDSPTDYRTIQAIDITLVVSGPIFVLFAFLILPQVANNIVTDWITSGMTWVMHIPVLGWIIAAIGGFTMISIIISVIIVVPVVMSDIIGNLTRTRDG